MQKIIELSPYIIGGLEILLRAIPTKKNCSIVHKALEILLAASSFLNNKKGPGVKIPAVILIALSFSLFSCAALKNTANRFNCLSSKTVGVTVKVGDSTYYTMNLPYCDTIEYVKKEPIDTLKAQ